MFDGRIILVVILIVCLIFYQSYGYFFHHEENTECDNLYKPCAKTILRKASTNNIVVLSSVSKKYKNLINNFWITSAIPNNLTKIVFVASDKVIYDYCKTFTKYILMGKCIVNQTAEIKFYTNEFLRLVFSRIEMIHRILSFGFSVLVTDLDIYLFKNPIPYILQYKEDIITSVDRPNIINVGF